MDFPLFIESSPEFSQATNVLNRLRSWGRTLHDLRHEKYPHPIPLYSLVNRYPIVDEAKDQPTIFGSIYFSGKIPVVPRKAAAEVSKIGNL